MVVVAVSWGVEKTTNESFDSLVVIVGWGVVGGPGWMGGGVWVVEGG